MNAFYKGPANMLMGSNNRKWALTLVLCKKKQLKDDYSIIL